MDLQSTSVSKLRLDRCVYVCVACLNKARSVHDHVYKSFVELKEVIDSLNEYDEDLLFLIETIFVKHASFIHLRMREDTQSEHVTVKTVQDLKNQSLGIRFLIK